MLLLKVDNRISADHIEFQQVLSSFESYYERGKGFSIYNVEGDEYKKIVSLISKYIGNEIKFITLSSFNEAIINEGKSTLVVYQDIRRDELLNCVSELVNKVLFPNWFYNTSIIYISKFEKKENNVHDISSTLIHQDYNQVLNLLALEQLGNILETATCQVHDICAIPLLNEKVIYTPIELILRDELVERNIRFEPQVKLGRFYTDFLVTVNNRKVIVECDGRDYHNAEKDRERDKELSLEGYQILRFTGSELYQDVNSCVDKIIYSSQRLNKHRYRLETLNEEQMNAVNHIEGPMRLLAPAGSGKTKTLINRVANLINQGVHPNEILALAFNKKASEEMEKRLHDLFGISDVDVRTFHSFGNQIIKEKLKWRFQIEKEKSGTRDILNSAVQKHVQLARLRNKDPLEAYLEKLSKIKNELLPYEEFLVEDQEKVIDIKPVFDDYLEGMYRYNFYNFDDMLYLAARILLDDSLTRRRYQTQYRYILVDEFQDLNKVQLLLLEIISLPENNVFIVGDDDQMIYGFRGAEIQNILQFNHRYAINKDQVLRINYRSAKDLVRQSKWLIDHNEARVYKDITSNMKEKGKIDLYIGNDLKEQCEKIADWIKSLKNSHNKWSDFAVLYRYNEFEINLYVELSSQGIPVILTNKKAFYSSVGRTIFAYLKAIYRPTECNNDEFKRILNTPNQYLTNEFIASINKWSDLINLKVTLPKLKTMNQERYTNFVQKLIFLNKNVKRYSASQVVASIVDNLGVKEHYLNQSKISLEVDQSSPAELVEIFVTLSEQYATVEELYNFWVTMYADNDDADQLDEVERDFVTLNSIHKTKGKEFEHVTLFNLSTDRHARLTEVELEEERRVAYVGFTRPIRSLLITTQKGEVSNFIREYFLNPDLKEDNEQTIDQEVEKLQTRVNILQSEFLTYESEIKELEEKYPEMIGELFTIEKPFRKLKAGFRKRSLNRGLDKHEKLQQKKTELLNSIELIKDEMTDFNNELKYRKLLVEGNSPESGLVKKESIRKNQPIKFSVKDDFYAANKSTELPKVAESTGGYYHLDRKSNSYGVKRNVNANWTRDEEDLLIKRFIQEMPIEQIAELHERKVEDINGRLIKLGLN